MQLISQRFFVLSMAMTFAVIFQACSGSGAVMNDPGSEVYQKDYDKMKTIVKNAIVRSNINIDHTDNSENEVVMMVGQRKIVEGREYQHKQGTVRVIKQDSLRTRVEVENPEYHFSVSEHLRKDYQRLIFLQIDEMMKSE